MATLAGNGFKVGTMVGKADVSCCLRNNDGGAGEPALLAYDDDVDDYCTSDDSADNYDDAATPSQLA